MKKILTLLVLIISSTITAKSQNWGGGVDEEKIHFGFTFQYVSSEFKVFKTPEWRGPFPRYDDFTTPPNKLTRIAPKRTPGFGIGFVVNNRLNRNMDLRLTPTLVFSDRQLQYVYANNQNDSVNNNITQKIQSTMVDFPLSLKIKSDRRKNYRAYLVGGLKYSMDITSDKKTSNEGKSVIDMVIQNRKNFVSYEAGLGLDLY
ncbi:MAG: hypothetical protein JWQ28_887, partial [Pedobacter sp.]|nr:hypothetical protein [Pedobacter sp.]